MKDVPSNPVALQARVFGALCEDMFDIGAGRSTRCDRVNALLEIQRVKRT